MVKTRDLIRGGEIGMFDESGVELCKSDIVQYGSKFCKICWDDDSGWVLKEVDSCLRETKVPPIIPVENSLGYINCIFINTNSKKNRLIIRLNKQHSLKIPLDYPVAKVTGRGVFKWYFEGDDVNINMLGSSMTMTDLLKYEKYRLNPLSKIRAYHDIVPVVK